MSFTHLPLPSSQEQGILRPRLRNVLEWFAMLWECRCILLGWTLLTASTEVSGCRGPGMRHVWVGSFLHGRPALLCVAYFVRGQKGRDCRALVIDTERSVSRVCVCRIKTWGSSNLGGWSESEHWSVRFPSVRRSPEHEQSGDRINPCPVSCSESPVTTCRVIEKTATDSERASPRI